jgi:hypothetical protein
MGHYILQLPTGEQADVRVGVIQRKALSFRWLFGGNRMPSDKKRAYIIHVGPKEYRLLRSMDGVWLTEGVGDFQPNAEDTLSTLLKNGILKHENNR